jgi:ATP phosphoribosyltransferase regulatory subunit HisZ
VRSRTNLCRERVAAYLAVADERLGREVVFGFLEKLAEDFQSRMGDKAQNALAHSLDGEYSRRLKQLMEHYSAHPEEASKVSKVQQQVSEVKGVMMENIEKVLDRGEKIDLLVDKTSNLRSQVFLLFAVSMRTKGSPSQGRTLFHLCARSG